MVLIEKKSGRIKTRGKLPNGMMPRERSLGQGRRRAQAAIFDGITFLLMVGFSCALVYSVVTNYGESMDNALNLFYEMNYLQSAVKSLYYLNLQQLSNVADAAENAGSLAPAYEANPPLDDETLGCRQFGSESYAGSVTVLDLLKKDLSDDPAHPAVVPVLDDSFNGAPGTGGVSAPGRQALRCALKELMKPFVLAGYDYYAEVVCPNCPPGYKAIKFEVKGEDVSGGAVEGGRATSNASLASAPSFNTNDGTGSGCALVQTPAGGSYTTLSMSVPLRISLGTSCAGGASGPPTVPTSTSCERDYILRVCIWQTR